MEHFNKENESFNKKLISTKGKQFWNVFDLILMLEKIVFWTLYAMKIQNI